MDWLPFLLLFSILGGIGYVVAGMVLVLEKGDAVDRSDRVAQLYGYTVCLVAIIVGLTSIASLIDDAFRYSNPLEFASYQYGRLQDLSSFETYKATYSVTYNANLPGVQSKQPTLSDDELRRQYEALRDQSMRSTRFGAVQSMTSSTILLIIAILLFAFHWRWLRQRSKPPATT